jgi:drug/metabolite transporter (DMT)-like permease
MAVVGFIGSFFPAFLFATAQTKINSSLAGMLSSLTPLSTLLLGVLFFKVKPTPMNITGVLVGLAGALWLTWADQKGDDLTGLQYGFLVLLACLFYGVSANVIKNHLSDISSLTISAVSFTIVGIPAIGFLTASDFFALVRQDARSWSSLGYLCILAILGTVIGSLLYFKLIKNTNALFASTVSYMTPMVAILLGLFDGEMITWLHLVGVLMILTGVYIARR